MVGGTLSVFETWAQFAYVPTVFGAVAVIVMVLLGLGEKLAKVVQVTVSVLVGGQVHPEPLPDGLEKPVGTVSVTVVGVTVGLTHESGSPMFVTVMVKVTVCPACTELGAAVLVMDRLHGFPVSVTCAHDWLVDGVLSEFETVAQLFRLVPGLPATNTGIVIVIGMLGGIVTVPVQVTPVFVIGQFHPRGEAIAAFTVIPCGRGSSVTVVVTPDPHATWPTFTIVSVIVADAGAAPPGTELGEIVLVMARSQVAF
jgi:hypothetical protein